MNDLALKTAEECVVGIENARKTGEPIRPAVIIPARFEEVEKENSGSNGALIVPATFEVKPDEVQTDVFAEKPEANTVEHAYAPVENAIITGFEKMIEMFKPQKTASLASTKKEKKEKSVPSPYSCMQELINEVSLCNVADALYYFNGIVYEHLSNSRILHLIVEKLRKNVNDAGTPAYVEAVRKFLYMEPKILMKPQENDDLVAFRNGVLDLKNWHFSMSTPERFFTSYVNVDFDFYVDNETPCFDSFLNVTFDSNLGLIQRVWEMIGYILTDDMNAKAFFVFMGVGDSGKSVLGRFISGFFDDSATASVDVFRIADRFSLFGLVGKRINASLDLPAGKLSQASVSVMKQLTGGDPLTAEIKYGMPFKFKNTCKLLFATNHPVQISHPDNAFYARMVVIPFKNSIPKHAQDHNLLKKLEAEKQGIVIKAIKAYLGLKMRNYIFSGEEDINFTKSVVGTYDDSVAAFVQQKCSFADMNNGTFTELLYDSYVDFCNNEKLPTFESVVKFSTALKSVCGDKISPGKWRDRSIAENPKNGYRGIVLL